MNERFLRLAEVKTIVGLGSSTIYRRISAATFPRPLELGPGCVRWRQTDIDAWMAQFPETKSRAA
jgi:prophage regulatory protein